MRAPLTHDPNARPNPAQADSNQSFCRMAEGGRIIRSYSGFLPSTRRLARHVLRCEHLRDIPGEGFPPYRAEASYTHQIWIWYRLNDNPQQLNLLFRGQFDFARLGRDPDQVAGGVTDYLAYLLVKGEPHIQELFRHEASDLFWALAVDQYLTMCQQAPFEETSAEAHVQNSAVPDFDAIGAPNCSFASPSACLRLNVIQQIVEQILASRKINHDDQHLLMSLFSRGFISGQEERLVNRVYDALNRGFLKVVD